jgi:membrane protein
MARFDASGAMRRWAKGLIGNLVAAWGPHDPLGLGAQMAYFAFLSMFPLVMFLLTVIGYLPLHGLDEQLIKSFDRVLPPDVAQLVESTLREIIGHQRGWLLLSTLVFAIWTASDGTQALTIALNRAHQVQETRKGWRLRARILLVTIGAGTALLVATLAMLVGPELVRPVFAFLGMAGTFEHVWAFARWPLALLLFEMTLACLYYFLPNRRLRWRLFSPGAALAVLGWLALSSGFKLYVSHFSSYARTYGALGTVILLLVYLYWSSVVVILGGEINGMASRRLVGRRDPNLVH